MNSKGKQMEKLGKFLLFLVNVGINLFLLSIIVVAFMWLVMDVPPNTSVRYGAEWIEYKWYSIWHADSEMINPGEEPVSMENGGENV